MNEEMEPVQWSIDDIIESLLHDRHDDDNPVIPDGIINLSYLMTELRSACAQGRLVKSNEPYEIGRCIGELMNCLSKNDNEARLQMMVIVALILREVTNCSDDVSLEECLMRALSPDRWDRVIEEFTVVPLVKGSSGKLRPNVACFPIFFRAKRITLKMLKGFSRRWLRPTLPYLFVDEFQSLEEVTSPPRDLSVPDFEIIDASEVMKYDADPLEGFDEFWKYFHEVEAGAYEKGYDIEDLDGLDEREGFTDSIDEAIEELREEIHDDDELRDGEPGDETPPDDDNDDTGLY